MYFFKRFQLSMKKLFNWFKIINESYSNLEGENFLKLDKIPKFYTQQCNHKLLEF